MPDRALTTAEMEGTVRRQGAFLPNPLVSEFVVATTLKGGSHNNRGDGGI